MSAHDDLQEGYAEALDALTEEFAPEQRVILMKASDSNRTFVEIREIFDKRFFEYRAYRQQFQLEISDAHDLVADAIADATHVKIDDDIYVIAQGDTVPPKGTDVTWKLFCERFAAREQFAPLY